MPVKYRYNTWYNPVESPGKQMKTYINRKTYTWLKRINGLK